MEIGFEQEANCRLVVEQVQRQLQELDIAGGTTESIFPEAEDLLFSDTKNQTALFSIVGSRNTAYRSVMDFLFCEVFAGWRWYCMRFYNDKELALRYILSPESIAEAGKVLVQVVKTCRELWEKNDGVLDEWMDVVALNWRQVEAVSLRRIA